VTKEGAMFHFATKHDCEACRPIFATQGEGAQLARTDRRCYSPSSAEKFFNKSAVNLDDSASVIGVTKHP
jgi:hypothetical protein